MRGKLQYSPVSQVRTRNIPAYAGKTMMLRILSWGWEEHPRVCGENSSAFSSTIS